MCVVVWNEIIDIPVSDFNLRMTFRIFDTEIDLAKQLGSGSLKPKVFLSP